MKKIDFGENKVHLSKPFDADYVASVLAEIYAREQGYGKGEYRLFLNEKPKPEKEERSEERLVAEV